MIVVVALAVTAAALATTLLGLAFAMTGNHVVAHEWVTSETIRRAPQSFERDEMRDTTYLPSMLARRLRLEAALNTLTTASVMLVDDRTRDDIRELLGCPPGATP